MCRRIYIDKSFDELVENFSFAERCKVDDLGNRLPRYNGAPAQVYHIIIQDNERQGARLKPAFAIARWGNIAQLRRWPAGFFSAYRNRTGTCQVRSLDRGRK
ncbi:hypothetical protein [Rhizobium bangladeshense]|uniref:hypothetical protein n=1 Tax=Rhizobium bangladeshense TaxID=1138189 RepID=UPI001FD883CE|nr:hypothetical protein [Rhizobium bangladeshense]